MQLATKQLEAVANKLVGRLIRPSEEEKMESMNITGMSFEELMAIMDTHEMFGSNFRRHVWEQVNNTHVAITVTGLNITLHVESTSNKPKHFETRAKDRTKNIERLVYNRKTSAFKYTNVKNRTLFKNIVNSIIMLLQMDQIKDVEQPSTYSDVVYHNHALLGGHTHVMGTVTGRFSSAPSKVNSMQKRTPASPFILPPASPLYITM